MATTFIIRPSAKSEFAPIFVRVQKRTKETQVNILQKVGLSIDPRTWDANRGSKFRKANPDIANYLDDIEKALDAATESGLTPERAKEIIHSIVFADEIRAEAEKAKAEAEAKAKAAKAQTTFLQYFRNFVDGIRNGSISSTLGTECAPRTITNYQQGLNKFEKYCGMVGYAPSWDDINMDFFNHYCEFLRSEGYNLNTASKRITEIKTLLRKANSEGLTNNRIYLEKAFNITEKPVDSIYLTDDDIAKICAVDLSQMAPGFTKARDIFLVGIYTAQRVSDYNNIRPEDIVRVTEKVIVGDEIKEIQRTYIDILQQKTKARVRVPANAELRAILDKYRDRLPHMTDQQLNRHIKTIARLAGLDEIVSIRSTKGGVNSVVKMPKWQLVHSHTARRTGCTRMYLAGIDSLDIMRISGHTSLAMLQAYIKASTLDTARKIADKYSAYFD